jgi:hypothetical protein
MGRPLRQLQAALLGAGTVFSWFTLIGDYRRFFAAGGRVFELSGCVVANPIATPCLYGALAFLIAFAGSVVILRSSPASVPAREGKLIWLLAAGTVFAWGNFGYEAIRYYGAPKATSAFSCPPGALGDNPFLLPCFYGALIFLAALITAWLIARGAAPSRSGT